MKIVPLIILSIFLLTCCKQNKTSTQSSIDIWRIQSDSFQIINDSLQKHFVLRQLLSDSSLLNNTIPNNSGLQFIPDTLKIRLNLYLITQKLFSQLYVYCNQSNFPEDKFFGNVEKKDSMLILKFTNEAIDTLTNRKSNQVEYSIIGYWEKNNLLLVKYNDWEESDFYIISMTSGKYFTLSPTYIISPLRSRLITFSNTLKEPTYSSGFLIARFDDTGINEEIKVDSDKWAIDEACWIDENTIIANISIIDYESFKTKETLYTIIKIK